MAIFRELDLELQGLLDGGDATDARAAQQAAGLTQMLRREQIQRAVDTHGRESGPGSMVRRQGSDSVGVTAKVLDFGVIQTDGENFVPGSFKPAFNDEGAPNFTRSDSVGSPLEGDVAVLSVQRLPPEKQTFRLADGDGVDVLKPTITQNEPLYRFVVEKSGESSQERVVPIEPKELVGVLNPKQVLEGVISAVKAAKQEKA